jgi:osmotically inducible protein OsmC
LPSSFVFGPRQAGGFGITADLRVSLPDLELTQAQELVAKAHEVCPYSNATRGNVDVGIEVV